MPVSASPELGASSHDNTVTIDDRSSKTITSISYVSGSLQITSGQPSSPPPSIAVNNNVWKITLQAGRKMSKPIADGFNSICGGVSKVHAKGQDDTPKGLNFYFAVTISFANGGSTTVYLAQEILVSTNWWIGGSAIFSRDKPRLEYQAGNSIVTDEIWGDHETFKLKQVDIRSFSPIKNVFVLMLENHSFDNMLALSTIPGIDAATTADNNSYLFNGQTQIVPFHGNAPESMPTDPGHEFTDVLVQLAGTDAVYKRNGQYPAIDNSGFAANYAVTKTEGPPPKTTEEIADIMAGFDTAQQLPALYQLATNFAVCDHWFSSLPGPTWPNRFFLHGASSDGLDHSPSTLEMAEWETIDGFHYPKGSIFDRMSQHGITWRLYHDMNGPLEGAISQVSSIHRIELWDVHELKDFESDVQAASYPYQYTFIEPNYGDVAGGSYENGTSQHPMDGVAGGEGLITAVYEAIRKSPIWAQSLLVITYDEHGGFYDHFAPGAATPPGDGGMRYSKYDFNFTQYGVRVPAVVVSPFINPQVDHTTYDHSSVLATLEFLFGLDPLTQRDSSATSLHLLLSTSLREDTPMKLKRPAATPRSKPPLTLAEKAVRDLELIPEGSTLTGMLGVLLKADAKIRGSAAARARFAAVKTRGDARAYMREVMAEVQAVKATRGKK